MTVARRDENAAGAECPEQPVTVGLGRTGAGGGAGRKPAGIRVAVPGPGSGPDGGSGLGTDAGSDSGLPSDTDSAPGSGSGTGPDADSRTGTGSHADSRTGTGPDPDSRTGRRKWSRPVRRSLAAVLVGGAAYGMWRALDGSGPVIADLLTREGAAPWLAGSAVVNLAGLALSMASWRSTLAGVGTVLRWGPTAEIFGATVLGKYLPGPFWSALAGVHLGRRNGVPAQRMVTAYVLNSVVVLLTAAVVGVLAAPRVMGDGAWWLLPVALALAGLLWRPGAVLRAARGAAKLLRRPAPDLRVADGDLRRAVVWEVLSWVVGGAHLWMISVVLGASGAASLGLCVGGFALAAAAGAAALVVPGGAGVREVVLMVVLTADLPWAQAGAAALASRLCCTVTEVLGAGTAVLAGRLATGRRGGRALALAGEASHGT
ncbi:lysylphosphatidylglycerol synthase domain-containing protein [Streptomyces sp. NPDC006743]|uniref:lysylphosphatidylglycerol synthase domain-containing protein n=1 Tax=Streptomyces sp. NPDC006743 TaxID=3154480 RepID=UPI0034530985